MRPLTAEYTQGGAFDQDTDKSQETAPRVPQTPLPLLQFPVGTAVVPAKHPGLAELPFRHPAGDLAAPVVQLASITPLPVVQLTTPVPVRQVPVPWFVAPPLQIALRFAVEPLEQTASAALRLK